jgi:hypothetical protein
LALEHLNFEDEKRVRRDCARDTGLAITQMGRHGYFPNAADAHTDDAVFQASDDAPFPNFERDLHASFDQIATAQEQIIGNSNPVAPLDLVTRADVDFLDRDAALFHERPNR